MDNLRGKAEKGFHIIVFHRENLERNFFIGDGLKQATNTLQIGPQIKKKKAKRRISGLPKIPLQAEIQDTNGKKRISHRITGQRQELQRDK